MNIAFDLDGVLYPWHESIMTHLKAFKNLDVSFSAFWKNPHDFVSKEHLDYLLSINSIYFDSYPYAGSQEVLNKLAEEHSIFYITSRPSDCFHATKRYLSRHGFPQVENLILSDKKAHFCRLLEIDYFFEDREEYVIMLQNLCKVILIRKPWNEHLWDEFITIGSVLESAKIIEAIEEVDFQTD